MALLGLVLLLSTVSSTPAALALLRSAQCPVLPGGWSRAERWSEGRLSCPCKERFSLLRLVEYRQQVVAQWGKEDEEEQLCSAAFNCPACRARGVSGSWLPELWVLHQKASLPTSVKETGPSCWSCPCSSVACKEVLVGAQRRDVMVMLLKLHFFSFDTFLRAGTGLIVLL